MKLYPVCVALMFLGLFGCEKQGPIGEAGERIDEIVDNVQHGDAPLKEKGVMEKAGESIDETIEGKK